MVQRCFYSVVSLKSVAVARAFSAAYVCGPVRWNVRFFAYVPPRRWNVHVPVVHVQRISNSRPPANFQCTTAVFNSNFRIRRNVHFSRHNLRPPQQLCISFVDCGISFARIADFFYILCRSLKITKFAASTLPILHYRSSNTYPPEPILQNLSSSRFCVGSS